MLIGVFDAQNGHSMTQSLAMDLWQGKPNAVQTVFTTFDESEKSWLFPALRGVWEGHKIPMITWEPKYWQQWSPTDIELKVGRGELDAYLIGWGQALRDYLAGPDGVVGTSDDRRAYLRFAHEMNGNWYPWSASKGESVPGDYVRMWRHVYDLFASDAVGLPRSKVANSLLWVWSPINFDVGDFKMDDYYPGHQYVDWVGVTGFNWGTSESWSGWWDPVRLFEDAVARVRAIGEGQKPVAITEYSTVPDGGDKNEWLVQFFQLALNNDVRMACYFNLDKFEQSNMKYWSIFGGAGGDGSFWNAASLQDFRGFLAYRAQIANDRIHGADRQNPRVVTDQQFRGAFGGSSPVTLASLSPSDDDSTKAGKAPEATESSGSGSADTNDDPNQDGVSPIDTSRKTLTVVRDSSIDSFDFLVWGGDETIANPKFVPEASSAALKLVEGESVIQVNAKYWGGFGIFARASQGTVSLAKFRRLRFSIAATEPVRIEIQDADGKKWAQVVKGTSELAWHKVSLSLSAESAPDGTAIDLTRVQGMFLATATSTTEFMIDNVYFEK